MVEINLTIDEIKAHLNLDHDLDDELLEAYKSTALEVCRKHIGNLWRGRDGANCSLYPGD